MDKAIIDQIDVSIETKKGLERCMTVCVPVSKIEQDVDARLKKAGKTARLKGFRHGKVPEKMVRQHYGEEIRQDVMTETIRISYARSLEQEELRPVGPPSIEALPTENEGNFTYRATFEVYPDITLNPTEAISVERPKIEVSDSDVDEMVAKIRDQQADWQEVERKSVAGDRVVIDFFGKVDGEPFEGGEGKEVPVVVGEGHVIEDFDKTLKGVSAGQVKVSKVKFPKDYSSEKLAGQKAVFDITVHKVEKKVLPDIDEGFLKKVGIEDGGLDALKGQLLESMNRELQERVQSETRNRAFGGLLEANKIEVPKALIEEEINTLQSDAMQRLGIEDPEKAPPRSEFHDAAQRRVAVSLLIQELIKENDIKLDEKRVDEKIDEFVARYEEPEEAARVYRSNKELMVRMASGVLEDQVMDFILENAKVKEIPTSFKEFMS